MQVDHEIQELTAAIAGAWRDMPYPGDRAISGDWDHEDEIAREMTGRPWQQLSSDFVQRFSYGDGLDRLAPPALAYYLPAFLTLALTDPSTQDSLARVLAPPGREHRDAWRLERFWSRVDRLSDAQKQVVARMFGYWREREWLTEKEWTDALEYWQPHMSQA
jgi:hypothetical protein